MERCPRCERPVDNQARFCPNCGTQLRVQPLTGELVRPNRPSPGGRLPTPWVAAILSIVPGLGHVYAGAPLRGLVFFVGVLGPELIGVELDFTLIGEAIGIPLGLGGLGLWAFSVVDAYRTARRRIQTVTTGP